MNKEKNMIAQTINSPLLDRPAIRFLMSHRDGRLETFDLATGQVYVSPVRYACKLDGSIHLRLHGDSEHAQAIREGGFTTLTVQDDPNVQRDMPLVDEDGLPTVHAVVHVNVIADAESVPADHGELLVKLRIRDLQVYLRAMSAAC